MSKSLRKIGWLLFVFSLAGCAAEAEDEGTDETGSALSSRMGVNSAGCKRSAYNCTLNPGHGQRVANAGGGEDWAVAPAYVKAHGGYVTVVDGNGDSMGKSTKPTFTLNYGQTRRMKNTTYVMAVSAGIGAAGWVPIEAFESVDSLRAHVGEVNAHGAGLAKLGCYQISKSFDPALEKYKVVKGATDKDSKEPDDYLPQVRSGNKGVYANLAFSVPGDDLGAPAIDIFPAGTKFQRLDVPTWDGGAPSLDVKLYSKPSGSTKYTTLSNRSMKFIYGYVKTDAGIRYGWMALDGLDSTTGCPDR